MDENSLLIKLDEIGIFDDEVRQEIINEYNTNNYFDDLDDSDFSDLSDDSSEDDPFMYSDNLYRNIVDSYSSIYGDDYINYQNINSNDELGIRQEYQQRIDPSYNIPAPALPASLLSSVTSLMNQNTNHNADQYIDGQYSYSYVSVDSNGITTSHSNTGSLPSNSTPSANPFLTFLNMFADELDGLQLDHNGNLDDVSLPLKEEELDNFEQASLDQLKSKFPNIPDDEQCSICFDSILDGENETFTILPCKHYFHKECIKEDLTKYHHKCPICKVDLGKTSPQF